MFALIMTIFILSGAIGIINGYRRVTTVWGSRPSIGGQVAPVTVGVIGLLSGMAFNIIATMSHPTLRMYAVAGGFSLLCLAGSVVLLWYDPARPRPPEHKM